MHETKRRTGDVVGDVVDWAVDSMQSAAAMDVSKVRASSIECKSLFSSPRATTTPSMGLQKNTGHRACISFFQDHGGD